MACEFQPLRFSARERGYGLTQAQVVEADLRERREAGAVAGAGAAGAVGAVGVAHTAALSALAPTVLVALTW